LPKTCGGHRATSELLQHGCHSSAREPAPRIALAIEVIQHGVERHAAEVYRALLHHGSFFLALLDHVVPSPTGHTGGVNQLLI
jgi:hypothetical protein